MKTLYEEFVFRFSLCEPSSAGASSRRLKRTADSSCLKVIGDDEFSGAHSQSVAVSRSFPSISPKHYNL
jgi:hypothetical protein